jgi:hypothetical protein
MTLFQRLVDLTQVVGGDVKAIFTNQGQLSDLQTTAKQNLVAAINECINVSQASEIDDDLVGTGNTYSSAKIVAAIEAQVQAAKDDIRGGVTDADLDSIKELVDLIKSDENIVLSLSAALTTERAERIAADLAIRADLTAHVNQTAANFQTVNTSISQLDARTTTLEAGLQTTNANVASVAQAAANAQFTAETARSEAASARTYAEGLVTAEAAARVAGDAVQAAATATLDASVTTRVETAKQEVMDTIGADINLVDLYRAARAPFPDGGVL